MGLLKLIILLDQQIYYSGQNLSGRLVVEIDEPMSMRAIHLRYSGKGTVRWTESHRHKDRTHHVTYSNEEHYLALQQLVFGNNVEDSVLAQGEHVFIFNCQLPMNLPSSFEGVYGRIRYSVKATIHRAWKLDHTTRQAITVMSICDLNLNPFAVAPVSQQTSKTFWGHSKELIMSVNLPVRGYVPGQIIPIRVFLNNESGVQIYSLYVSLKQNVTFHATTKSRSVKNYVFRNEFPVPNGSSCEEVPLDLQLPAVPPSNLEFSRIIDLNYQLNITARASGWYHRNLKIPIELIVGNIPVMAYQKPIPAHQILRENVDQENPSYSATPDYQPPGYGFVVTPGMDYEGLPPPTYEQCMGLTSSEKEGPAEDDPDSDGERRDFSPLYPVYKFETK